MLEIKPKKIMNTHALVNINDLVKLSKQDDPKALEDYLLEIMSPENRGQVLNDQEVLLTLSRCIESTANNQDDLNDRLTGIFFKRGESILRAHGVIK